MKSMQFYENLYAPGKLNYNLFTFSKVSVLFSALNGATPKIS
jgi:hypothetical protein